MTYQLASDWSFHNVNDTEHLNSDELFIGTQQGIFPFDKKTRCFDHPGVVFVVYRAD